MKKYFKNSNSHNVIFNEKDNSAINWDNASDFYSQYRPAPPVSYFRHLLTFDIGSSNQKILDLGTGTGNLALQFARQGSIVTGIDASENQILEAVKKSKNEKLQVDFLNISAEELNFNKQSFDVVSAMQAWPYFNQTKLIQKLNRILKSDGTILVGNFDHLPLEDEIALKTESLMCKYNPKWTGFGYDGFVPYCPQNSELYYKIKAFFFYDELIPFSVEGWIGRIIASQPIGATLTTTEVLSFKKELEQILNLNLQETVYIKHRLSAHIMSIKRNL